MAKLYPGGILIGTNFKISQANPVADYMVVSAKTDLTNTTILPYQFTGMTTFVVEDQNTYVLKNTGWQILGSGSSFTGGTVTGATIFSSSLSANTISATTYNGYIPYNSTNPNGFITSFTGGTVSGATVFTSGLTANTISATTISLPYTSGSVLFIDSTGQIAQKNSLFFWDNTNNRLGIGTSAPTATYKLTVSGNTNMTGSLTVGNVSASSFTSLQPNSTTLSIGSLLSYWDTLYANTVNSPNILTLTSANNIILNAGGTEAARIFNNGNVSIGTSSDSGYKLDVLGTTRIQGGLSTPTISATTYNGYTPANQDGTILYHSTPWFTPSGTVSTINTTVTSSLSQFTSAMIGAKLTISGESRIIAGYGGGTTVYIAAPGFSQNYSNVPSGGTSWAVYSKAFANVDTTNTNVFYDNKGVIKTYYDSNGNFTNTSTYGIFNNTLSAGKFFTFGTDAGMRFAPSNNDSLTDVRLRRISTGLLQIDNGTTDTAYRDLLLRNLSGSSLNISGTTSATTNLAQGNIFTPTLVATANNDVLVGVDIIPTFNIGSFTGVTNYATRFSGATNIIDTISASGGSNAGSLLDLRQTWNTTGVPTAFKLNVTNTQSGANSLLMDLQVSTASKFNIDNTGIVRVQGTGDAAAYVMQLRDVTNSVALRLTNAGNFSSNLSFTQSTYTPINNAKANQAQLSGPAGGVVLQAVSTATTSTIDFVTNGFASAVVSILAGRFTNTGNFLLGGTTDIGSKLQIQGTTSSDGPTLGIELAISGTGTNWTGTAFSGAGYTHATGSTVALTSTLAAVIGTYYQITYTINTRTAGSITINYGGTSNSTITATGTWGPLATSTAVLSITPTTDFDGTLVLSIKAQTGFSIATTTFTNSSGTVVNEIRNPTNNTNTFIGQDTGRRVTTGLYNTFFGNGAGKNNTTGQSNTFIGFTAGQVNSIGTNNTFLGVQTGLVNTTGGQNTFIGQGSGNANIIGNNNTFLGQNCGYLNTNGNNNTFLGLQAGYNNTSGQSNVNIGMNAGNNNTTGSENIFMGYTAGRFISGGTTPATVVTKSILIGANTKPLADAQTNQIVIGDSQVGLGSNTTIIGTLTTTATSIVGNVLLGTTNTTGDTTTKLQVSGTPGTTAVKIIGSGNSTTPPIFTIQGSKGELFSVNDSLTGSLFSVNDISGLPILEVFSDDTVLMGSYLAPSLNTTDKVTAGIGLTNIASIPTSTYTGAFFDYTINDGTNLRAGNIMSIWSGTTVQYTETSTNDIGNTSGLTFNMIITGSTAILRTSGITAGWTVKTIVRSI